MAISERAAFCIRPPDGTRAERALLAGIWRRGWVSSNSGLLASGTANEPIEPIEPIEHWLTRVEREFTAPTEVCIAERHGQPVGFMAMLPARGYVAQLFVEPHLHRQGFGRRLLDVASQRMPRGWRLHVATDNTAARRFYEGCGLDRGAIDHHPESGRERLAFNWRPVIAPSRFPIKLRNWSWFGRER